MCGVAVVTGFCGVQGWSTAKTHPQSAAHNPPPQGKVAIARLAVRTGNAPNLVALLPQLEELTEDGSQVGGATGTNRPS